MLVGFRKRIVARLFLPCVLRGVPVRPNQTAKRLAVSPDAVDLDRLDACFLHCESDAEQPASVPDRLVSFLDEVHRRLRPFTLATPETFNDFCAHSCLRFCLERCRQRSIHFSLQNGTNAAKSIVPCGAAHHIEHAGQGKYNAQSRTAAHDGRRREKPASRVKRDAGESGLGPPCFGSCAESLIPHTAALGHSELSAKRSKPEKSSHDRQRRCATS